MNKLTNSEQIAYDFLKEKYSQENIQRLKNPDFKVNNQYFEIKKLIGKNIIVLTKKQIATFDEIKPIMIITNDKKIINITNWNEVKITYKICVRYNLHNVNIDEKNWNEFVIQSRRLGKSASGRISDFIKKELNKLPPPSKYDKIPTKKVDEEGRVR